MNRVELRAKVTACKRWIDSHPVRAATFAGWFQQAVTGLSAILVLPVLLSSIGAADAGVWLAFQGFVMLAGLADFGVGIAVTRQAAHCLGSSETTVSSHDFLPFGVGWRGIQSLKMHAAYIYRATVIVACLAGAAAFEGIIVHTKLISGSVADARLLWYVMLVTPCLLLLTALPVSILNGVGKIFMTRSLAALYFGVQAIAISVAAIITKSLLMMALTSAACSVVYCVTVTAMCSDMLKKHSDELRTADWSRPLLWRFVRVAVPLGFVNIGAFLTSSIQVPLLGAILGPAAVAPFFLAQKIGQFLLQASLQFSAPKTILFSSLLGRSDPRMALDTMFHGVKYAAVTLMLSQLAFVFVVPVFAPLLLGAKDYPDFSTTSLMGLDYLLLGLSAMLAQFVIASGSNPFVVTTLIGGILNLVGVWILVPRFALMGIPMASLLAGILTNYGYATWCWLQMVKRIRLSHAQN